MLRLMQSIRPSDTAGSGPPNARAQPARRASLMIQPADTVTRDGIGCSDELDAPFTGESVPRLLRAHLDLDHLGPSHHPNRGLGRPTRAADSTPRHASWPRVERGPMM